MDARARSRLADPSLARRRPQGPLRVRGAGSDARPRREVQVPLHCERKSSAAAPFASSFEASKKRLAQAGSGGNMTDGDCKYGCFGNGGKICGSGGFGTQFGVTKTGDWIVGGISNQSVQEQLGLSYSTGTYAGPERQRHYAAGPA